MWVHHKIEKKKPCHQGEALSFNFEDLLATHLLFSLQIKYLQLLVKVGREDLMVQSTHVTWHNKSCIFCMQWYYHTQNWRVESPISQNLNAKWSFFWVSREGTRWLWSRKEITFHTHRIWSCNTSLRTYHVYMHKKHLFILLRCSIPFTMVINNTKLRD